MSYLLQEDGSRILQEDGVSYILVGTTTIAPAAAARGYVHDLYIDSDDDTFTVATNVAFSGAGVTVTSVLVVSTTRIRVRVTITAGAALTSRDVTITTGAAVTTMLAAFRVAALGATGTLRNGFKYTFLTRGEDIRRMPGIVINDILNNQPNTAQFSIDGTSNSPAIAEEIEITDSFDGNRLLFRGNVQRVQLEYEELTDQLVWRTTCIDRTWMLNKYRPIGVYNSVSVSNIVVDMVANSAPGFTTTGVQTNLAKVTAIFDGSQDFSTCLNQLAEAIGGGHWRVDYNDDVRFFHIIPTGIILPEAPQSIIHVPSVGAPQTAMVVTDGGVIPSTYNHTPVYAMFSCSFVYDNGVESSQSLLSNPIALDPNHAVTFSSIPVGARIGTHNVVSRRLYMRVYTATGLTTIDKFCVLGDNVTTSFTTWWAGLGANVPTVTAPTTDYAVPIRAYVAPPAPPAGSPVASQATASIFTPQPPLSPIAALTYTPGPWAFKVAVLYRDGTESQVSLPSNTVILDGTHAAHLTGIPVGPVINSVDAVARIVYACQGSSTITTKSFAVVLAELKASKAAGTLHNDYGSIIGYGDADVLQSMSSIPTTYVTLAQVIGYADLEALLHSGTINDPDWSPEKTSMWYFIGDNTTTSIDIQPGFGGGKPRINTQDPNVTIPVWPNPDGPNPEESLPQPTRIDSTNTYLLRDPALTTTSDLSQVRNRINVRGAGSSAASATQIGGTVIEVADTTLFSVGGGYVWAGNQKLRYTGLSNASGLGTITLADRTTKAIEQGSAVNLFFQADDPGSQRTLALVELDKNGKPTDGVHEYTIIDTSLVSPFQLYMRAYAELELFANPIVTVNYATRDPNTRSGAVVSIDLSNPPCVGDFLIQSVTIDQIHDDADGLSPRYSVSASSVKFDLSDLLLKILANKVGDTGTGFAGVTAPAVNTDANTDALVELRSTWNEVVNGTTMGAVGATWLVAGANNASDSDAQTEARYMRLGTAGTPGASFASWITNVNFTMLKYAPITFFTRTTWAGLTLANIQTASRVFAGMMSVNPTLDQESMQGAGIAFRYSPIFTTWFICVNDGTAQYDADCGVTVDITSHYKLRLDITQSSAKWTITVTDTGVTRTGTVAIPTTFSQSVGLFPVVNLMGSGIVQGFRVSRAYCSSF